MLSSDFLAVVFVILFAVSAIVYAILDGYDLGVGILMPVADKSSEKHRDNMIASIGPFWDANETWIVLTIGILLIAFPAAYNLLLGELYIPVALMLVGLIFRGISFDFRSKAALGQNKLFWDRLFKFGSILMAATQGYMLGAYIMGFEHSTMAYLFSAMTAIGVIGAYALVGSTWLILKTRTQLNQMAQQWARTAMLFCALGIVLVSMVSPLANELVADRWFGASTFWWLMPFPLICAALFYFLARHLLALKHDDSKSHSAPMFLVLGIFVVSFIGLAVSFFPYVIPGQLTIWETVASANSLTVTFIGAIIVLPLILGYTAYTYYVFRGKSTDLRYD